MESPPQQNPSNPPTTLSLSSTSPPPPPPLKSPPPPESDTQEPAFKKPKMSSSTATSDDDTSKPRRYKRRKVAIFFAYCGVGYQGMQKNPGAKTIEGDLEEALYLSGAVPEDERGQHKRYDWARSARTDKGVSAVGQVVSGRFFVDPPGFVQRLNSILPPQVRIFGYKRATPSFSAKKFCDRRRYVYLLPVFALDPSCHRDRESVMASLGSGDELVKCVACSERGRKVLGLVGNRRGMRNVDVVQSGVSLNGCDELMLDTGSKVNDGVENGEAECLKNGDALMLLAKENVAGNELKSDEGIVEADVLVQSSVSSIVVGEKAKELEEGDLHVEKETTGGEDLKNDVAEVKSEVLVQSGVELNKEEGAEVEGKEECPRTSEDDNGGTEMDSNGTEEGTKGKKCDFVYGDEVKERFNRILKYYEGTHNYHNFTTRTKAEDPSAKRYIVSFKADTTLTLEGIEFIKCEVVGQSFMLHQIRKMMGMAVAVMRNFASESIYETAFDRTVYINVPTAPEVGLYLDECFFTSYNNKWHGTHEELSMKTYAEEAEEFKLKYIYSHIGETEHKEGAVAIWLHSLNRRNYPDLCQPSPQGLVEKEADP